MVSQDVETDGAVRVDVRMVDLGGEADLGRLEGVVGGKGDGQEEYSASVWRVALLSQDLII